MNFYQLYIGIIVTFYGNGIVFAQSTTQNRTSRFLFDALFGLEDLVSGDQDLADSHQLKECNCDCGKCDAIIWVLIIVLPVSERKGLANI